MTRPAGSIVFAAAIAVAIVTDGGRAAPGPTGVPSGTTIETPETAKPAPALIGHPPFRLLDADGGSVFRSGEPVSTVETCGGGCHDVDYIDSNNYHAQGGFAQRSGFGSVPGGRPWDAGPGTFGRWDPLLYRVFDPDGGTGCGADIGEWVRRFGWRHTGGGPASAIGAELNCFLCHIDAPDNDARVTELREGRFEWAATATLAGTGLVRRTSRGWSYDASGVDERGFVAGGVLEIVPPTSAQCGLCHGLVHRGRDPVWPAAGPGQWSTETKGQVFAAQHMSRSAMNLAGKKDLKRPWDIHAVRLMECTNCHYLLNDPAFNADAFVARPAHLDVDTRRQSIGEFLKRPLHQFVKGYSAAGTAAPQLNGSMRRCEGCHNVGTTHEWLPYKQRHMTRLLCESCHIPRVYAPARRVTDWTVISAAGGPRVEYRGVDGPVDDPASLIEGFAPVLLPRATRDDRYLRLAPHNVIASWYWVYGDPPRPVPAGGLDRAFRDGGSYASAVLSAFDHNRDGTIDGAELVLDTPAKTERIRQRLESLGFDNPRIVGEVQPFGLHHGVAAGEWATRSCEACHNSKSVITAAVEVASVLPGGVVPRPVGDTNARMRGEFTTRGDGRLVYRPASMDAGFYVLGHDRWRGIDAAGLALILAVVLGAGVHGGLRYRAARLRGERS